VAEAHRSAPELVMNWRMNCMKVHPGSKDYTSVHDRPHRDGPELNKPRKSRRFAPAPREPSVFGMRRALSTSEINSSGCTPGGPMKEAGQKIKDQGK
jgi:hypothetical protein